MVIAVMSVVVEPETLRNLKKPHYIVNTGAQIHVLKETAVEGADFGYGASGCETMHGLAHKKDLAQISGLVTQFCTLPLLHNTETGLS